MILKSFPPHTKFSSLGLLITYLKLFLSSINTQLITVRGPLINITNYCSYIFPTIYAHAAMGSGPIICLQFKLKFQANSILAQDMCKQNSLGPVTHSAKNLTKNNITQFNPNRQLPSSSFACFIIILGPRKLGLISLICLNHKQHSPFSFLPGANG